MHIIREGITETNKQFIYPNQYIIASDTSASYPKQVYRNYGKIKYLGEIYKGRIPLIPGNITNCIPITFSNLNKVCFSNKKYPVKFNVPNKNHK